MRCQLGVLLSLAISTIACGGPAVADAGEAGSETSADGSSTTAATESGSATASGGDGDGDTGDGDGDTGDGDGDTGDGDGDGDTGDGDGDTGGACVETQCEGKVYECGDCIDNDDDANIDFNDVDCWGPCDNNESGWKGEVPGQNDGQCKMDCYWDANTGSGNDECNWSHNCDPLEPSAPKCTYDPDSNIQGTNLSCAEAQLMQGDVCADVCGPLTPNGCDCFGCCEITVDNVTVTVFVGTNDDNDEGSCNIDSVLDPEACSPCTQVQGCLNDCVPEDCELCFGQQVLPDDCDEPGCPDGITPCLQNSDCPPQTFCNTGCCYPNPG